MMNEDEKELKISLGCGKRERDEFVGLDVVDFGWNTVWDAWKEQIPFGDGEVDFIEAHNFFEHIERYYWVQIFNECWRVLSPSGELEIVVPNAIRSMELALADLTHVSLWTLGSLKYLTGERPRNADYGIRPWIILDHFPHQRDDRVDVIRMRPNK